MTHGPVFAAEHGTAEAPAAETLTSRLAAFIHELRYDRLPPLVVERARLAILDTVGVALAATRAPIGQSIIWFAGSVGGSPQATILGTDLKTSAIWAAFANGTLAHALDYDDTNYGMNGHMSSILVPVALAVAEREHASGRAVIEGYVAGFEVGSRLGRDMNPDHYEVGWHSTATLGHLVAAAAAAKVRGLDERATRMALGIAATEAGGLRVNIGTMTKPLHSGLAAKNGVLAADLAAAGWSSADDAIGGRYGFVDLFSPNRPVGAALDGLGETYDVATVWVAQKPYPSCAASHRAIDALLDLRTRHGFAADEVERIDCGVDYMVPTYMTYPEPRTAEEARFSMEYTLAVAATDGRVGLEQYEPERLGDPRVRDLARRVRMYIHPEEAGRESWKVRFVELDVRLRDSRAYQTRVYEQRGHPNNPMSLDELKAKYRDAAGRALDRTDVEKSMELLLGIGRVEAFGDLMRVLGRFSPVK